MISLAETQPVATQRLTEREKFALVDGCHKTYEGVKQICILNFKLIV